MVVVFGSFWLFRWSRPRNERKNSQLFASLTITLVSTQNPLILISLLVDFTLDRREEKINSNRSARWHKDKKITKISLFCSKISIFLHCFRARSCGNSCAYDLHRAASDRRTILELGRSNSSSTNCQAKPLSYFSTAKEREEKKSPSRAMRRAQIFLGKIARIYF